MRYLFFILFLINFLFILADEDKIEKLDYYVNYTLIPPTGGKIKKYLVEPNFDIGTLDFTIYFSSSKLSCTFVFYDGNTIIDETKSLYASSLTHTLKVPDSKPKTLRMEVSNYNHEDPYYLYMYNKNYIIPLNISFYYLYQISVNKLEIKYEINDLIQDTNLKLEAKIQYPQYKDNLEIILNEDGDENRRSFSQTSSFSVKLKKNKSCKLKLNPEFNSEFTNETYFFISFEKEQNFPILFYKNDPLIYSISYVLYFLILIFTFGALLF